MDKGTRVLYAFVTASTFCALVLLSYSYTKAEGLVVHLPHPVLFQLGNLAYAFGLPILVAALLSPKAFPDSDHQSRKNACYLFAFGFTFLSIVVWLGAGLNSVSLGFCVLFGFLFGWVEGYFRSSKAPYWFEDSDLTTDAKLELFRQANEQMNNHVYFYLGLAVAVAIPLSHYLEKVYRSPELLYPFFLMVLGLLVLAFLQIKRIINKKIAKLYQQKEVDENLMRLRIEELHSYILHEKKIKKADD